jgi:hypothetical protein
MRVGVYVDGFNLYFGARSVCGRGTPGWRWLDLRALAEWPVQVRTASGSDVPGATFMVSYLDREEKGTDVNVATLLLVDVLGATVDAAVVVSNDSDLELPIHIARQHVPVGVANPGRGPLAGKLRGLPSEGAGDHWWQRIGEDVYRRNQLPERAGSFHRPKGW